METRALLIFADSAHTDCKRRGWPSAFRILLETQRFEIEENAGIDLHLFTTRGPHGPFSSSVRVHLQEGTTFGQRLENAIESLAQIGYQEIVIVGRDCPDLGQGDIAAAFEQLRQHRVVLGPDHRGGCYLIGIHANDRERLQGVCWQRNRDFREICHRFEERSVLNLPVKLDLDTLEDVWLLADSQSLFRWMARTLLDSFLSSLPLAPSSALPRNPRQRVSWQLPPPLRA